MSDCGQAYSLEDPARPAKLAAQREMQHILHLWKRASEKLALSIPLTGNTASFYDSFYLARQVFHTYEEVLTSAFAAISALPNVVCVWKSRVLQYQWTSRTGSTRRLIHAIILEYVEERMDDEGCALN